MLRGLMVLIILGLVSCSGNFVRDGLAQGNNLINGFISPDIYQLWYEKPWDNRGYYIAGLEDEKKNSKPVRFIDLIVGSRAKIDHEIIKKAVNQALSEVRCGHSEVDLISQINLNRLSYKVYKEEYYLNGMVKWLIRVRAENLKELVEDATCVL